MRNVLIWPELSENRANVSLPVPHKAWDRCKPLPCCLNWSLCVSIVACKGSEDLKSNYEILSTKRTWDRLELWSRTIYYVPNRRNVLTPLRIPRYILHRRYQNCYNLSVSLQFSFNLLEDNFVCKGWELSILLSKRLFVVLLSLF